MYDKIFFTNVLRVLRDRDIKMKELSNIADVSESYLSDFGRGQANLSLKKMEQIANAIGVELPVLLSHVEPEVWPYLVESGDALGDLPNLPPGFERIVASLTSHQAYQVKKWDKEARRKIKTLKPKD